MLVGHFGPGWNLVHKRQNRLWRRGGKRTEQGGIKFLGDAALFSTLSGAYEDAASSIKPFFFPSHSVRGLCRRSALTPLHAKKAGFSMVESG